MTLQDLAKVDEAQSLGIERAGREAPGFLHQCAGAGYCLELNADEQVVLRFPGPCSLWRLTGASCDSEWDMEKVGVIMVFWAG